MPLPLFPEHITIDVQVDGRCEGGSENEREKGGKETYKDIFLNILLIKDKK